MQCSLRTGGAHADQSFEAPRVHHASRRRGGAAAWPLAVCAQQPAMHGWCAKVMTFHSLYRRDQRGRSTARSRHGRLLDNRPPLGARAKRSRRPASQSTQTVRSLRRWAHPAGQRRGDTLRIMRRSSIRRHLPTATHRDHGGPPEAADQLVAGTDP
jgi:hypothetical protein